LVAAGANINDTSVDLAVKTHIQPLIDRPDRVGTHDGFGHAIKGAACDGRPRPQTEKGELVQGNGLRIKVKDWLLGIGWEVGSLSACGSELGLRVYKVRFTKQTWPGETLATKVTVKKKYEEHGEHRVDLDCEVVNENGEAKVSGVAVASLPSK